MIVVERDGTLPLELLVTSGGVGQTGLSPVVAVRDAGTDGSYLDFADGAFKTSGWTTRQAALTEISATNAPGKYVRRLDLTTVTLPSGEHLAIEYSAPGVGVSHETARLERTSARRGALMALYKGAVWIDTVNGAAGTTLGTNGTETNPVLTLADALTLATALGVRTFRLRGTITLTASLEDWRVIGHAANTTVATVNANGQSLDRSEFTGVQINGAMSGRARFVECLMTAVTGLSGVLYRCRFAGGGSSFASGGGTQMHHCVNGNAQGGTTAFTFTGAHNLVMVGYEGDLELAGMTLSTCYAAITMRGRRLVLGATNTDGTVRAAGMASVEDAGGGVTVERLLAPEATLRATVSGDMDISGSVAQMLATLGAGVVRTNIALQRYELLATDGTTVLQHWPMSTTGTEPVTTATGVQTTRGAPQL